MQIMQWESEARQAVRKSVGSDSGKGNKSATWEFGQLQARLMQKALPKSSVSKKQADSQHREANRETEGGQE